MQPPEEPIVFRKHEEIEQITIIAGNKRLLNAGIGMGLKALDDVREYRVLLAGYPGTGKTVYPRILARQLPDYSLLYIKGNSLMKLDDIDEIKRRLGRVESYLGRTPLIVAFDELDLLALTRAVRPVIYTTITGTMMDLLDHKTPKTLTLVMANFPLNLDMAVTNRLQYTMFFDLPDAQTLGEALNDLGIPNSEKVGKFLYEMAEKSNGRLVTRSVVNACREVRERVNDPFEMGKLLFTHATQFDIHQIEEYERLHRGFRLRSDATIAYWERVAGEYVRQGKHETKIV